MKVHLSRFEPYYNNWSIPWGYGPFTPPLYG
jgi:hypothetical protein